MQFKRSIDARYRGQGYELNIPFTKNLINDFRQEHNRRYGYAHTKREIEIVTLRLRAVVKCPALTSTDHVATKGHLAKTNDVRTAAPGRPLRAKLGSPSATKAAVVFEGKKLSTAIYSRDDLQQEKKYSGPAIVTEYSATTVIPPNKTFHLDSARNLIVKIR